MSTIFITVPAYEELTLVETFESAIDNATNPNNLYFLVALQYKKVKLPDLTKYYNNPNFKFISFDVDTRPGVVELRHQMAQMHNNEDYFLMIDSHMTFAKGWDSHLIGLYQDLVAEKGEKVIISKQLPDKLFEKECKCQTNGSGWHSVTTWCLNDLDGLTIETRMSAKPEVILTKHEDFRLSHYSSNHFWFTTMKYVKEYGIMIPDIQAYCEETYFSYRVFMQGWRIYAPIVYDKISHNYSANPNNNLPGIKSYSTRWDYPELTHEIIKSFAFNEGKYKIENSEHEPYDFYKAIGLQDHYSKMIQTDFYKQILKSIQNQY